MIVDANVLIYAVDDTAPFHATAHSWLTRALNGDERVGLPWVSLTAFQRIITHPRLTESPMTAADAWDCVTSWLATEQAWVPSPGVRHARILERLLTDGDLRGNLVTDAHVAALALEHGVGVCSYDSDFARFPGLLWLNPQR